MQQANPLLRGHPIAVSGRPHIHSVAAAASIEAKKFGVKSGMSTVEAKKLCPQLIFIPGDPAKYIDITAKLIKIFKTYTPIVEIFSIDEAFLDLTPILSNRTIEQWNNETESTIQIALEIKARIKTEIGPRVTCSIGIAKNKLLAKLASEKKKPDGLTIINDENMNEILLCPKLDDFCGIGPRILDHLHGMGIYTILQLRQIPLEYLTAAFGIRGRTIYDMARGEDDSPVAPDRQSPDPKSFSHSLTLEKATTNRTHLEAVMLYLSEKVARRMRAENFCGKTIHLWLSFTHDQGTSQQKTLAYYTADGKELFSVTRLILSSLPTTPIRALGIGISSLVKRDALPRSFLPEQQKSEKIISCLDKTNDRFGENTVFRAAILPIFSRDKDVAGIRTRFRFQ